MSLIKNAAVALIDGARTHGSPSYRKTVLDYGEWIIDQIYVGRSPVEAGILKVVNLITLGSFEKQKNRLNYDRIYHLFMLLKVSHMGQTAIIRFEKEEVVRLVPVDNAGFNELSHAKDLKGFKILNINIPLSNFLARAESKLTTSLYFSYNATTYNCQNMLINALDANKITGYDRAFILQDALALVSHNPVVTFVLKSLTTLGAIVDRIKHGTGITDDDDILLPIA